MTGVQTCALPISGLKAVTTGYYTLVCLPQLTTAVAGTQALKVCAFCLRRHYLLPLCLGYVAYVDGITILGKELSKITHTQKKLLNCNVARTSYRIHHTWHTNFSISATGIHQQFMSRLMSKLGVQTACVPGTCRNFGSTESLKQ